MAEEALHIRRSYQIEGERRWVYWSAVQVTDEGERIIASTQPLLKRSVPPQEKLMLGQPGELPAVAQFEFESRLARLGKALVEGLEAQGWEAVTRDASGQVVRMRRAG